MIDEFKMPHHLLLEGSYIFKSKDMKRAEKVLIPSIKILRVMGMRKFKRRKIVKNVIIPLNKLKYTFTDER